jgi:hypothetical protein
MDRPHDVGVPGLEATHCQWPQGMKVNHFMTRGIGAGKHAREALVAGSEFIKLIARDGYEAPPWPEDSLTRTWTREDEDMESAQALRIHCARRSEESHAVPVRATALMASDSSSVRRIVSLSRSGLGQSARTAETTAGSGFCEKMKGAPPAHAFADASFRRAKDSLARDGTFGSSLEIK